MEGNGNEFSTPQDAPPQGKGKGNGAQAVVAAITAIAGLVLCTHPTNPVAQAVSRAIPQLGEALPPLIAACGTIVAAISQPPKLGR